MHHQSGFPFTMNLRCTAKHRMHLRSDGAERSVYARLRLRMPLQYPLN